MYFWRYVNFDTETEDACCGISKDLEAARKWAKKTWEQESAKGGCRVDVCEVKTDMTSDELMWALHEDANTFPVRICETWER